MAIQPQGNKHKQRLWERRIIVLSVVIATIAFVATIIWIWISQGFYLAAIFVGIIAGVATVVSVAIGLVELYNRLRHPSSPPAVNPQGEEARPAAILSHSEVPHMLQKDTVSPNQSSQVSLKHCFVNFNSFDRRWAEWITWQLGEAGYSTLLQNWEFQAESNFVLNMQKDFEEAECMIVVLSPDYLKACFTEPQWATAFFKDAISKKGRLLLVQVRECRQALTELLEPVIYIDLVGQTEAIARERLLTGLQREHLKPTFASGFPSGFQRSVVVQPGFPGSLTPFWNVPHKRNPFFTDREDILNSLHEKLTVGKTVALIQPFAMSGLGGIGKTQTAIEYTYRHHDTNQAVLWAKADSREALISDFVSIAGLLDLPEKDDQNQSNAVGAVKRWLQEHGDWLIIFDNADDLAIVKDFLPPMGRGHVLLTTRAQSTGTIAQNVEIDQLDLEESMLLLLRRAKIIPKEALLDKASEEDRAKARELSETLGGLPLALDQAGAYIEESKCGLEGYLNLYRSRRADLLKQRGYGSDHPQSVTTTWSLSFEKIEQANPAAAESLRLFSFLYPDAIPEEIIAEGASELSSVLQAIAIDPLELNAAIKELRNYSLVGRNPETGTLTIHRLVQAVLKDRMDESTQRQWAERTVRVVNRVFPEVEFATWPRCQRYLPHAQTCAALIEQWNIALPLAAQLLNRAGCYLQKRSQYTEAEPFLQKSLDIRTKTLQPEHLDVAQSLYDLAELYYDQGKYSQAEPLYQSSLAIREKALGPEHPALAQNLNQLAKLYRAQGKYAEMESLLTRALAICEKNPGTNYLDMTDSLLHLGRFYREQGKYPEAEARLKRALAIREQTLELEHPAIAQCLSHLAGLYVDMGKYTQAEPLLMRALAIREKKLGPEHRDVAYIFRILARLYNVQGKYAQAESFYKYALVIWKQVLGAEHPNVAETLRGQAILYYNQGKYSQSEPLFTQVLKIFEQSLGPIHPEVGYSLNFFARLYRAQGKHSEAETLLMRAQAIYEQSLGPDHPDFAQTLNNLAEVYYDQGRYTESEQLLTRSLAIREKTLGREHPSVAQTLHNLAELYRRQGQYSQAEAFYQRALMIREQSLGEHPLVAQTLQGLALLYSAQDKYREAESLFLRALLVYERTLGPNHFEIIAVLENYTVLLQKTKRKAEAMKLEVRANAIRTSQSQEKV